MATSETVKRELRDIRYYYLRKAELDEAFETLGASPFKQTVERYKNAIREAPLRLYDLYACLYLRGETQEAVAVELGYTPQYVRKLVGELFDFFRVKIG